MAYKCKNCGKFVAKNATICKHCGQENPAALEDNNLPAGQIAQARPVNAILPKQIQCPYCGSLLSLPKQFENDDYLRCNICNQDFANPLKKTISTRWIDGSTMGYPNRTWRNAGLFLLAVIVFYLFATKDKKESQPEAQQFQTEAKTTTPVVEEDESRELVVVDGEAVVRQALPKSDYDIINRWREIIQGTTSQECRLERIKRDGSYRIKIGGIYYSCEPRKITRGSEIVFHDANSHNGEYFNLANGTPIYYIPGMEDDGPVKTDGILVIQADGSAQVYMNDYKHEFFELFTDLRPLY
jgi:DNA-directed RNA polymerase subunit RPC12/RpoP